MWRLLESLPTPRRNVLIENLRLQQVYEAIYANALDIALERTPIGWPGRGSRDGSSVRRTRWPANPVRLGSGSCSSGLGRPT